MTDASLLSSSGEHILIIDDEEGVCLSLSETLQLAGYRTMSAKNGKEALSLLEENSYEIILCDLLMPEMNGMEFLQEARARSYPSTIIMMSAYATVDKALEAIKLGAYDYIAKPFGTEELLLTLRKAEERERLRLENESLRAQVTKRYSFSNIIGNSQSMLGIFETIKKIADYKTTVLIQGESGTGKELVARAIHFNSARRSKAFVAINCSAIPENLLESELFGHKKGAFTDATRDKKGLFEEANGGTLLLDEVGELPLHLQVKLLRVLQLNEIRPVGDTRVVPIDVRIIAATLRDLEHDVLDGRFRDDLFYRLHVIALTIPPLRDRKEDIPMLVTHFIKKNQEKLGLAVYGITKEALAMLLEHPWPGNIRELENCIERSMILTEGSEIDVESLPPHIRTEAARPKEIDVGPDSLSIKLHSRAIEENLIRRALAQTHGNRTHAARLLEISHRTLLYKLKEYGIDLPAEQAENTSAD